MFTFPFRQQRYRAKLRKKEQCKLYKKWQRNNVDKDYQSPSHADSYLMPYETPVEYKKQIRQCTFNVSHMLKSKSGFRCTVIGCMIKKLLKSPTTKRTMLKI